MASGDSLLVFRAEDAEFPAANFPALITRNLHLVLGFDTTTGEACYFSGVMPQNYSDATGITVYVHWAAASATSGTIGWLVAIERIGEVLDIDADSFAADQTITAATVNGTSGIPSITSIAITKGANMDSLVAGEAFRLRITRDVANDNAAGDAQLLAVEIRET